MKKFITFCFLIILGLGFYATRQPYAPAAPEPINPHKQTFQTQLEEALIEYDVYRFPKDQLSPSLYASNEPTSFLEWQDQLDEHVLFNGGYFLDDYSPAGAIWINGEQVSNRFFDLDKSGLVYIKNNQISLIDTSNEKDLEEYSSSDTSYLQAYPFLIKDGKAAIEEDSELLARRTVLATTETDLLVIIVDRTPVSLHELMLLLLEGDLGIKMALNLDGGPSTAFLYKYNGLEEASLPISGLPQILGLKLLP